MTKFGSDSIEYDRIGNPTIWGQKNEDGIWFNGALLEWQGRQLQSYQPFDEYDDGYGTMYYPVNFKYNDEGIRTYKEQDGIDHEYILNGSQIVGEWIYNRTILILYIYDETGSPIGMKMRTNTMNPGEFDEYFFEKNLQIRATQLNLFCYADCHARPIIRQKHTVRIVQILMVCFV